MTNKEHTDKLNEIINQMEDDINKQMCSFRIQTTKLIDDFSNKASELSTMLVCTKEDIEESQSVKIIRDIITPILLTINIVMLLLICF